MLKEADLAIPLQFNNFRTSVRRPQLVTSLVVKLAHAAPRKTTR